MLFTNLGRIVAVLTLILGIFYVVGGLMIATGLLAPEAAVLARYFRARSLGVVFDRGIYLVLLPSHLGY